MVDFIDAEGVKPVFVSASSKHTLCLDTEGSLWYFGEKAAVGISDKKEKFMFYPKKLQPSNENGVSTIDTKFRFVAAGPNLNLAIA